MNKTILKAAKYLKSFTKFQVRQPVALTPQHGIYIAGGFIVLIFFYGIMMRSGGNTPLSPESKWTQNVTMFYDPLDLLDGGETIQLIDIRVQEAFEAGRISGAVNLPFKFAGDEIIEYEGFEERLSKLSNDSTIVLYGENIYQKHSYIAADYLESMGYNVQILRIGWNEFRNFPSFWIPEDRINDFNLIEHMELQDNNQP